MGKLTVDKVMEMGQALDMIKDGSTVGLGGLIWWRRPIKAVKEIIRKGLKDLTAVTFVGSIETDMLAASGCVNKVHATMVSLQLFGLAQNFRKKVEKKQLAFIEHTEISLLLGLKATALRLPFLPSRSPIHSDLVKIHGWETFHYKPTNEWLVAIPALKLDVAIIHMNKSDPLGNAQMEGVTGVDLEMVMAADKVIITTEKLVSTEEIMKEPHKTKIFSHMVDAVVECPNGAYPTSCHPYYLPDALHMLHYAEKALDEKWMQDYLVAKGGEKGGSEHPLHSGRNDDNGHCE